MASKFPGAGPSIPPRSGVGLKAEHYGDVIETRPQIGWFEVHPENYMGAGGPPHHFLTRVREHYPLSLHGVGLSIGGAGDLDEAHLDRFKALVDRYQPGLVSEHLAWSSHDEGYFNDLLPLPYTEETLGRVCEHIDHFQTRLRRPILLENPSVYVTFEESVYGEIEFLGEIAARTGCGLLLDVNNVLVTCTNTKSDPEEYIDRFPMHLVGEIHLAGHAEDRDDAGDPLLIDAHDRDVAQEVWRLFERTVARAGAKPCLVEWDNDIPGWDRLHAEAQKADAIMQGVVAEGERGQAHGFAVA